MGARLQPVPVTLGSPRFRTVDVDGLAITEAWFPPDAYLAPHVHERGCFAVMLDGSFDVVFRHATHACPPTSVHTEPVQERHANRVGHAGAHVVVVQPDPARDELLRPLAPLMDGVTQRLHGGIAHLAARLALELDARDAAAPLVLHGLALEMLGVAARGTAGDEARPPAWLLRAQEYLHAHRLDALRLADVAAVAGVHPTHLTRAFRRHFRTTPGAYVRRLRLEWAAAQLVESRHSLAAIADQAGFADQAHFTRAFGRFAGVSPGRYRAARARDRSPDPRAT
jgi:AraC family transcriptional regulator